MLIKKFDYKFGKKEDWIFKNLNIEFSDDNMNVLVGPNGVGKSTLLDCIADVDDTRATFNFLDFPSKEEIAYQLQGVPFIGEATVKRTIEMMLQIDGDKSTDLINIPNYIRSLYSKKMGDLSGGQRRLVIIYGISLLNRKLYLFDEPESGLDPEMSKKVIQLLNNINDSGKKVIITTHQFENINENHKIFFLGNKKCLFSGSILELSRLTKAKDFSEAYKYFQNRG